MAERVNADHGLVDAWTAGLGGPRTAALLDRLDQAVAWDTLVKPVAALPEYRGGEKGGRPAWPALTMLKCVLLAKWFGLSDPQLEECLQDGDGSFGNSRPFAPRSQSRSRWHERQDLGATPPAVGGFEK